MLSFAGCDYLGLARHPRVLAAAADALQRHGLSSTGSRGSTGDHPLLARAEQALTELVGGPALLCPSGLHANLVALSALAARGVKVALIDELAHHSLFAAAAAAGLRITRWAHGKPGALERARQLCTARPGQQVVISDSSFVLRPGLAPLEELLRICGRATWLLLDDSHGIGLLGERGEGVGGLLPRRPAKLLRTFSLGKALGAGGGGLALAPDSPLSWSALLDAGYQAATAPAPAVAGGLIEALALLAEGDARQRLARICDRIAPLLPDRAPTLGIPFVVFRFDDEAAAAAWDEACAAHGLSIPSFRYPERGRPQLLARLVLSAAHDDDAVDQLAGFLTSRP